MTEPNTSPLRDESQLTDDRIKKLWHRANFNAVEPPHRVFARAIEAEVRSLRSQDDPTDAAIDEAAHELQRVIVECGGDSTECAYDYLRGILAKLPPSQPIASDVVAAPEDRAEQFIQGAIDNGPEPLRRLGEHLARVLGEDQWPTAERMLLGAALAAPELLRETQAALLDANEKIMDLEAKVEWHKSIQRALDSPDVLSRQSPVEADLREFLGKMVRAEWMKWALEQTSVKPSWRQSWDELTESEREVDRRIGEAIWRFSASRDIDSIMTLADSYANAKVRGGVLEARRDREKLRAVLAASPSDTSQGVSDPSKCPTCGWPIGSEECVGQRAALRAKSEASQGVSEADGYAKYLEHKKTQSIARGVMNALAGDIDKAFRSIMGSSIPYSTRVYLEELAHAAVDMSFAALRSEPTASSIETRSSKVGDWFAAHPQANAVIVLPDGCMVAYAAHHGAPPPGSTVFFRKGISIDLRGAVVQQGGNGMHPISEAAIFASRSEPTGEQPIDDAARYRWVREHVTWAGDACNEVKWVFYVPMEEPDISAKALEAPDAVAIQLDAGIDAVLRWAR